VRASYSESALNAFYTALLVQKQSKVNWDVSDEWQIQMVQIRQKHVERNAEMFSLIYCINLLKSGLPGKCFIGPFAEYTSS
jgi:hypothetical protein